MLVTALDWDSYKGKYVIGRINRGSVKTGQEIAIIKSDGTVSKARAEKIFETASWLDAPLLLRQCICLKAVGPRFQSFCRFDELQNDTLVVRIRNPQEMSEALLLHEVRLPDLGPDDQIDRCHIQSIEW